LIVSPKYSDDDRKHIIIYNIKSVDVVNVDQYKDITHEDELHESVILTKANNWVI